MINGCVNIKIIRYNFKVIICLNETDILSKYNIPLSKHVSTKINMLNSSHDFFLKKSAKTCE